VERAAVVVVVMGMLRVAQVSQAKDMPEAFRGATEIIEPPVAAEAEQAERVATLSNIHRLVEMVALAWLPRLQGPQFSMVVVVVVARAITTPVAFLYTTMIPRLLVPGAVAVAEAATFKGMDLQDLVD